MVVLGENKDRIVSDLEDNLNWQDELLEKERDYKALIIMVEGMASRGKSEKCPWKTRVLAEVEGNVCVEAGEACVAAEEVYAAQVLKAYVALEGEDEVYVVLAAASEVEEVCVVAALEEEEVYAVVALGVMVYFVVVAVVGLDDILGDYRREDIDI